MRRPSPAGAKLGCGLEGVSELLPAGTGFVLYLIAAAAYDYAISGLLGQLASGAVAASLGQ